MITLDATTPAALITRRCGADYVFSVKGNAPETFDILDGIDWETDGRFKKEFDKAHGRLEQRSIRAGPDQLSRQIARMLPQAAGKERQRRSERQRLHRYISSMRNTRRQRNCCGRGPWKT